MELTYSHTDIEIESSVADDRAPNAPMIGFIIGSGISLVLWALIAYGVWLLLA